MQSRKSKRWKRSIEIPDEQRTVLVANAIRSVSLREIEVNYGISKSTISNIVHRAKKRKQAKLELLGLIVNEKDKKS